MESDQSKKLRGWAWIKANDPEYFKIMCSKGGKEAHALGLAHKFTSEEGRAAGRKGGLKCAENKRLRAQVRVSSNE
jgi:general stress protein YciG